MLNMANNIKYFIYGNQVMRVTGNEQGHIFSNDMCYIKNSMYSNTIQCHINSIAHSECIPISKKVGKKLFKLYGK